MAEAPEHPPSYPSEPESEETLDLRQLANPTRPVMTSAGLLEIRRLGSLGPVDRTRAVMAQLRAARKAREVDDLDLDADDAEERLERVSEEVRLAEDALLRQIIVDPDQETLDRLDPPERVGVIAAFFGATPEAARGAVQDAAALIARLGDLSPGAKRSRGSRGSSAARTRRAG